MIPDFLLHLACAEFPTRQAAMKQAPYGNDRIIYEQPSEDDLSLIHHLDEIPYERLLKTQRREMTLTRLPSGFWAFLPTHPNDLAIVSEHKKKDIQFGKTQILCSECRDLPDWRLSKDDGNKIFDRLKIEVKRQVTYNFVDKVDQDKIYRIAYIESQLDDTAFGRLVVKISAAILYAEF